LHGITALLEFLLLLRHFGWDLLRFITGDTNHLITGRIITVALLGIGFRGTGKTDGLPMDGSDSGPQVTGVKVPDDQ
jgi:hypothetical protein